MATLHVRNVPDELMERLRERARAENRSISAELVTLLERALREQSLPVAVLLERMSRRLEEQRLRPHVPDSLELIREDRGRCHGLRGLRQRGGQDHCEVGGVVG